MSFLIKIIVWLSTVVITGCLSCGLAIAGDDNVAKQQDKQQVGEIVEAPSSKPFDADTGSSEKNPNSTEAKQN